MLIKWGIAGAIVGIIFGLLAGGGISLGAAFLGAVFFIAIRKWLLFNLWI